MEEAVAADLVLHVIDVSHPQYEEQRTVAEQVLRDLGVPAERVMEVYNKVDRAETMIRRKGAVAVSALTGRNIDKLVDAIRERELAEGEVVELVIPHSDPRMLAQLHEVGVVYEQRVTDNATYVTAWVPRSAGVSPAGSAASRRRA